LPTYSFKDKATGDVFDKFMSMGERETYLKDNPNIETVLTSAAICDPIRLGGLKPPSGFKEVLNNIHSRSPGSVLKKSGNLE
jgi:hypothetical protein